MVQIVHIDLEAPNANLLEERVGDCIPLLRYDLEGGLDPDRIIQVHEL